MEYVESEDVTLELKSNFPDLCLEQLAEDFNNHFDIAIEAPFETVADLAGNMVDSLCEEMSIQRMMGVNFGKKLLDIEKVQKLFEFWIEKKSHNLFM